MNSCFLTASITAIANAISQEFETNELTLLACVFVQLGDTLATIATQRALCDEKNEN